MKQWGQTPLFHFFWWLVVSPPATGGGLVMFRGCRVLQSPVAPSSLGTHGYSEVSLWLKPGILKQWGQTPMFQKSD